MLRFFATALLMLWPASALAWGFDGHRRLAKMMQDPLPASSCLRQWLGAQQSASFQNSAADPDRWRLSSNAQYDPNEWPRHYLEIDRANSPADYPRDFVEAERQFGKYASRNGQVPWRVEEYYAKAVEAFRSKDTGEILKTLAHFSHYICDSFSVLHNTQNFDPNGLHSRWESDMLGSAARIDQIASLAAKHYGTVGRSDAKHNTFDIVIVGNGLVAQLIAADQAANASGAFDMEGFFQAVKDLTARRWGDALTLQASLVATAWMEAGSPALAGMPSDCTMALPQGEVVLVGFSVPGGFTHPDAGVEPEPLPSEDAGPAAGEVPVEPDGVPPPQGCSAAGAMAVPMALLGIVLARSRRRR